jgi:signal transduction histidine kinase
MERRAREEKRMLLDMLTHEIKNPLASISFAVSTLTQGRASESGDSARRFDNIARSVGTIDQIIERCNLANGLEDQRVTAHLERISPAVLLSDLIATSFESSRIELQGSTTGLVETDPYLIRVVAANLIDNALKYAVSGSVIRVKPFEQASTLGQWGFVVCNRIDASMAPDPDRVFDRYYRHPLAQRLRGSGLGLSLSREVVRLLGGNIVCRYTPSDSNIGQGDICFEVTF